MKKLLILFLAFGLLTACNNNKTKGDKTDTEKTSKDNTENKDNKDGQVTDNKDADNNTTSGWPQVERDAFIGSCVDKFNETINDRPLAESYCECMLNKLEGKYRTANDAASLTETEMTEMAKDCLQR